MTPDEARRLLDGTTPGPWVRRRDADGNPTPVVVSAGPTDRHHIMTAEPAASPERQQADTALIAAAPTLAALAADMRAEYRTEYQAAGGRWFPVPRYCSCGSGWGTKQRAELDAAEWKADGYATRIIRHYVTKPEEV